MITPYFLRDNFILEEQKLNIGDLVTTILGDYGIVINIGEHNLYKSDNTEYYHVLIEGHIHCYLSFALIKIKKCLTKQSK